MTTRLIQAATCGPAASDPERIPPRPPHPHGASGDDTGWQHTSTAVRVGTVRAGGEELPKRKPGENYPPKPGSPSWPTGAAA